MTVFIFYALPKTADRRQTAVDRGTQLRWFHSSTHQPQEVVLKLLRTFFPQGNRKIFSNGRAKHTSTHQSIGSRSSLCEHHTYCTQYQRKENCSDPPLLFGVLSHECPVSIADIQRSSPWRTSVTSGAVQRQHLRRFTFWLPLDRRQQSRKLDLNRQQ